VALCRLSQQLIKAQQLKRAEALWTEAEAMVRTIEDDEQRGAILCELGKTLAQAHEWDYAEKVWAEARTALEDASMDTVFRELNGEPIGTREYKKALAEAFYELSRTLVKGRQWNRAESVIDSIEAGVWKAKALIGLSKGLVPIHEINCAKEILKEAESILPIISWNHERVEVLRELIDALVALGEHRWGLYLAQYWCLQVDTRDFAPQLLPIITRFMSLR